MLKKISIFVAILASITYIGTRLTQAQSMPVCNLPVSTPWLNNIMTHSSWTGSFRQINFNDPSTKIIFFRSNVQSNYQFFLIRHDTPFWTSTFRNNMFERGIQQTTGGRIERWLINPTTGAYVNHDVQTGVDQNMTEICGYSFPTTYNFGGNSGWENENTKQFPFSNGANRIARLTYRNADGSPFFPPIPSASADGAVQDGIIPSLKANVADLTNSNALRVAIVDGNGDQISSMGSDNSITPEQIAQIISIGIAVLIILYIIKQFTFRGVG